MNKTKILYHVSRIIFGITFVFSGFVKGIDPWGSSYKFADYFNVMGLEWFVWLSFPLGILFAFTEFIIGVTFLFNWSLRLFSGLGLLFMGFFLPLTLWIAIKNPVTDCGCFGDALIVSNWETFFKNMVLTILVLIVFKNRITLKGLAKIWYSTLGVGVFVILYVAVTLFSFNHLPIFDFRSYKVGTNIPEAMSTPDDAPKEIYKNIFYYKNKESGKVKKFSDDNYPWKDTINWESDNTKSILVQKGYAPPINYFQIETIDGENIIDFFIYDEDYVFIVVAYDLHKSKKRMQNKINELARWATTQDFSFIGLTATAPDETSDFIDKFLPLLFAS